MNIEKAYKYIRRWKNNNNEWRYEYPKGYNKETHSFRDVVTGLTNKTTEITNIKPLRTEAEIDAELIRLKKLSDNGQLRCPALGNCNIYIEDMTTEHAKETNGKMRTAEAKIHKLQYLAFVEPILKNGILFMKSRKYNHSWSLDKIPQRERTTYGIINKVSYYDDVKNKNIVCGLEIVVAWDNEHKRFVLSFIDRPIKKSLLRCKDFSTSFEACQVGACNAEALSTAAPIISHSIRKSRKIALGTSDVTLADLKEDLLLIKKSLLKRKDFMATCEASLVGACNAEALSTTKSMVAHSAIKSRKKTLGTSDVTLADLKEDLLLIKKSLLKRKDFMATCEASLVGACRAEAQTTAKFMVAHSAIKSRFTTFKEIVGTDLIELQNEVLSVKTGVQVYFLHDKKGIYINVTGDLSDDIKSQLTDILILISKVNCKIFICFERMNHTILLGEQND